VYTDQEFWSPSPADHIGTMIIIGIQRADDTFEFHFYAVVYNGIYYGLKIPMAMTMIIILFTTVNVAHDVSLIYTLLKIVWYGFHVQIPRYLLFLQTIYISIYTSN